MVNRPRSEKALDSFMIPCRFGKYTFTALLDSGARVGCMNSILYDRLKHLGVTSEYTGPQLETASGQPLCVRSSFSVDLHLGLRTTIQEALFTVIDDLNTDVIL